jgi:tetratricopeptide (TPR) repeat protein
VFNQLAKIIILYISVIFVTSYQVYASRIDELMNNGNLAYQQNNYQKALNYYNQILNEGYVSFGLYYNLGNTYFRLDKLGMSILYYERALKLSPNDEDAIYNLEIVKARTIDRIKEVPKIFVVLWWDTFIAFFSPKGWSILVVTFYIILLIIIIVWFYAKTNLLRQTLFYSGIVNAIILAVSIIFLFSSLNRETSKKYGILLQEEITTKLSPDLNSGDAFLIHEGVKFEISDELNDWSEIKLSDGKVGWIPKVSFEEI